MIIAQEELAKKTAELLEKLTKKNAHMLKSGDVFTKAECIVSMPLTELETRAIAKKRKSKNESTEEYLRKIQGVEDATGHFAVNLWCKDVRHEYPKEYVALHTIADLDPRYRWYNHVPDWYEVTEVHLENGIVKGRGTGRNVTGGADPGCTVYFTYEPDYKVCIIQK